ncbi:MAG: hypothetical protein DHS20C21_10980 [Gemmatimonadota bacterium]|nr:MAG: hypothetical protein DHS20C21_10980 [Gemmatimonadota bacterium]
MTSQTTSELAANLALQFRFSHGVFHQNVEGFTHAETLVRPQTGGNCMNWVGGHLAGARNGILRLLGQEPVLSEDDAQRYARGSAPITEPGMALEWDRIVAAMNESQIALMDALGSITAERLAAPLPADRNPFQLDNVGEMLGTFAFHEAYHVGQLGVLRRVYGKKGAIA